ESPPGADTTPAGNTRLQSYPGRRADLLFRQRFRKPRPVAETAPVKLTHTGIKSHSNTLAVAWLQSFNCPKGDGFQGRNRHNRQIQPPGQPLNYPGGNTTASK